MQETESVTVYVGEGSEIVAARITVEFDEGLIPREAVKKFLDLWSTQMGFAVAQHLNSITEV